MQNYLLLEKEIKEINRIGNIISIISWDVTVNMPIGSAESRTEEISLLSSIIHSRLKSKKIKELIIAADTEISRLNIWQTANLQEIKRKVMHTGCISDDLQYRYISAITKSEIVWREARRDNDFNKLKPYLQEVLNAVKEIAEVKSNLLSLSKYDASLDEYDPGRKSAEVESVFVALKKEITELIPIILEKQKKESVLPPTEIVSIDKQKLISKKIMEVMGFDFTRGRLDESLHPYCGGTSSDVRLTTRYNDDLIIGIMNVIHETGHGLYEQGLPLEYANQPVGKARSMAIHESQSLFMEMQVGRSREFSEFLAKLLKDELSLVGQEYLAENIYRLATKVKPDFIRTDADEVTYALHIILRYEIEESLINDRLSLNDLPECWNSKMLEYLGISPITDREGCLQDIHWSMGLFGYFPAYTNGAIIASMLMNKAMETIPSVNTEVEGGKLDNLNQFLNSRIRKYGSLKSSDELIKDATGEEKINPQVFLKYLKQKYLN